MVKRSGERLRRRWVMRLRRQDGAEAVLDVQVPEDDGTILARLDGVVYELTAEDVSRVRALYADAQAVALRDRGRW